MNSDEIKAQFKLFDKNNDGFITLQGKKFSMISVTYINLQFWEQVNKISANVKRQLHFSELVCELDLRSFK